MESVGKTIVVIGVILLSAALTIAKIPQRPRMYMGLAGFGSLVSGGLLWLFSNSPLIL